MTVSTVKAFRDDFQTAIAKLEKQYGVVIKLGTIRYDRNGLRSKMTATFGDRKDILTKNDISVGDIVKINHKKVDSSREFEVIKIMSKNIKVQEVGTNQQFTVSPNLLTK